MNKYKTNTISKTQSSPSKLGDYAQLVKFKLTMMVVVTSVMAYAIAAGGTIDITILGLLTVGGFFVASAANCLNQVLEKEFDALMDRTKSRPLPSARMRSSEAVFAAGIFSLIGVSLLAMINPLTGLISMISLLIYAFLYTPLKRHSTISVAVGAIPGALPVMIGCTAVSGTITMLAIVLFAIQFLWQFPHFWAIGYLGKEDYEKAGYKLLPLENGEIDRDLGKHASIYALILCIVVASMFWVTSIGVIGIIISLILSIVYLGFSIHFHRAFDRPSALKLMFSSFVYLPLVLLAIMIF